MGEIVNLRRARKRKAREEDGEAAEAARVRSGLSKLEREAARLSREKAAAHLDGHLRGAADPDEK